MTRRLIDLTNQKFGRLTVVQLGEKTNQGYAWLCRCECGREKNILGVNLRTRQTKSCGCILVELNRAQAANRTSHGHCKRGKPSPTYTSYRAAKRRCEKLNDPNYSKYGGRGIRFMFTSIQQLVAEIGERPLGKSLDRYPNPDGNYEPGNVRWATPKEQANNRRETHGKQS